MDNNEFYEVDTVIFTEEDGSETEYAVLDRFELDGNKYAVMAQVVDGEAADEDYLFRYEEDGNDMIVSSIEDDAEFERASDYYDSLCEEGK